MLSGYSHRKEGSCFFFHHLLEVSWHYISYQSDGSGCQSSAALFPTEGSIVTRYSIYLGLLKDSDYLSAILGHSRSHHLLYHLSFVCFALFFN